MFAIPLCVNGMFGWVAVLLFAIGPVLALLQSEAYVGTLDRSFSKALKREFTDESRRGFEV